MAKVGKISTVVALDGEAAYREACKGINANLRLISSEMRIVTAEFGRNTDSVEGLTKKQDVLKKSLGEQSKKVNEAEKALQELRDNGVESTAPAFMKMETALNGAKAEMIKTQKEIEGTETKLEDAKNGTKDFGDEANKTGDKLHKLGEDAGRMGKALAVGIGVATAAAGALAVKLGKEVATAFGELEQNLGGSEAVFGDYAAGIQKSGEEAYKNLGVSQSEYLATANKMGALFQGSGLDQQKSLELTEQAMQRAADMASVMGIDMQIALDSVAGAAKGNFTMMDNLGVAMNATNIEAYALANGLDFTWKTASQAEKAEVAMQMFFENTEQYAGNFARESTQTISGSIGMMQAALASFTAGLGNADADMVNLTQNLVDAFGSVVDNITPVIDNIVKVMPRVTGALLEGFTSMLPALITTAAQMLSQVLVSLMTMLPTLVPVVIAALNTIVNTLIDNVPMIASAAATLIISLAGAFINMIPLLIEAGGQLIAGLAQGLGDALPFLTPVTAAISFLGEHITELLLIIAPLAAAFVAFNIAVAVTSAVTNASAVAAKIAAAAQLLWNGTLLANPIGLVVAGVAALTAGIIAMVVWINRQSDAEKELNAENDQLIASSDALVESMKASTKTFDDKISSVNNEIGASKKLSDEVYKLAAVENKSAEDKQKLASMVDILNNSMDGLNLQYDAENDALSQTQDEIGKLIEAREKQARATAAQERAVEIAKEQMAVEEQLNNIHSQREDWEKAYENGEVKARAYKKGLEELAEQELILNNENNALADSFDYVTNIVVESMSDQTAAVTEATISQVANAGEQARAVEEAEAAKAKAMEESAAAQTKAMEALGGEYEKLAGKATDMFDTLSDESKLSVDEMIGNLLENQRVLGDWADNIAILADRGINQGLLEKLRAMGPEGAGYVAALVTASDEQLGELNRAFENGGKTANEALATSLGVSDDVVKAAADLADKATDSLEESLNAANISTIGKQIVDGLARGIRDNQNAAFSAAADLSRGVKDNARATLEIRSPSRAFREIGQFTGEGFIEGLTSMSDKIAKTTEDEMSGAINAANRGANKRKGLSFEGVGAGLSATVRSVADGIAGLGNDMRRLSELSEGFPASMKTVTGDMRNNFAAMEYKSPFAADRFNATQAPVIVNAALSLDGEIVTKATSKVQSKFNGAYARAVGVMA